ncbi:Polypeptide N-Acetylgalactosaminyltransferase-Like 6 [Manis pentadactyla]|nr:Polypeptide N-Acetylgalactosaminyltransferase-Like 6 [Manis pentadactyla]
MKRKQKRVLQMTLFFTVALIFLPNIGLWALYRDKHLARAAQPAEPQRVNKELHHVTKIDRVGIRLRDGPLPRDTVLAKSLNIFEP